MIHWLVQSSSAHPGLAAARPPAGLFSARELARFEQLKSVKRKHDRLLGRWTAKRLIQSVLPGEIPLDEIEIANDDTGAPVVRIQHSAGSSQPLPVSNTQHPMSISISHSRGRAFCVLVERESFPLGADLEWVEPRADTFVSDFFTDVEMAQAARAAGAMRDVLATAIWSAKEAALKALRVGLMVDTRAVTCRMQPVTSPPKDWARFAVAWDFERLARGAPALQGWWRVMDGFVLAIAAGNRGGKVQISGV